MMRENLASDSRKFIRKASPLLLLLAGSFLFQRIIVVEFYSVWTDLGWRKPVAEWLIAHGCGRVAGFWGLVWINIPEFLLSFIVGLLSGLLFRSRWFLAAGVSYLGFSLFRTSRAHSIWG